MQRAAVPIPSRAPPPRTDPGRLPCSHYQIVFLRRLGCTHFDVQAFST